MTPPASQAVPIARVLEGVMRINQGRLLAALASRTGDVQRSEDALQEAMASALTHWGRAGVPNNPEGWLLRAALRKAIDGYRRDRTARNHAAAMERLAEDEAALADAHEIPDDRLRLIFTCCHPALEPKSQVALTLRTICGLTTTEIARAFLDQEAAMGQRLSRAKARIAATGMPFRVPDADEWDARLGSVLSVLYLIFNAGYGEGTKGSRDLGGEAIFLARLLDHLRPGDPEIEGALALMLLTHARRFARTGPDGATVPPSRQDRELWDMQMLAEGVALLNRSFAASARPGPYALKAAISACHVLPDVPDWSQILLLYDALLHHEPTPVVRLNRAVALAETGAVTQALAAVQALQPALDQYQPFYATQADLLLRAGLTDAAIAAFDMAISLATRAEDAAFLCRRRDTAVGKHSGQTRAR